jgi:hypothetical protein
VYGAIKRCLGRTIQPVANEVSSAACNLPKVNERIGPNWIGDGMEVWQTSRSSGDTKYALAIITMIGVAISFQRACINAIHRNRRCDYHVSVRCMFIVIAAMPRQSGGLLLPATAMWQTATEHRVSGEGNQCQHANGKEHSEPTFPNYAIEVHGTRTF